jgi:hypothetical protein
MTVKELFDFVTDPTVNDTNIDDYLDRSMKIAITRVFSNTEKVDDEVSLFFFSLKLANGIFILGFQTCLYTIHNGRSC